jgi:hypothetical protein
MNPKKTKPRNFKPRTIDAAVVALIEKRGPGLSKPCPINFYLYFSSEEAALKSAMELRKMDFSAEVVPSAGSKNWLCLASRAMIPEPSRLVDLRSAMVVIAMRYEGEYDGWEAEIHDETEEDI